MTKLKNISIKVLVEIARFVVGATFMFSGFVKAVDPYGTAYKIEDYLAAFNLSYFSSLAILISMFLCLAEFLMGAFMFFGIYRRWNSRLILLTMLFMTPLTLYLAIADPVDDCGCFGDALVISNWATFYKNLVLLAMSVFLVIYCERIFNFFTGKTYWLAFLYIIAVSIFFIFQNWLFEPIIDFRPYHIGSHIPDKMKLNPEDERVEETVLIYSKDGVEKEFTDQNAPWDDESWEYVDMRSKIVREGKMPQIQDFSIVELFSDEGLSKVSSDTDITAGTDITDAVLSDSNYTFLMISPSLSKMSTTYLANFEDVADYAREYNYNFYCLTASGGEQIVEWMKKHTLHFSFGNMDERVLKTMLRSNPGLILLKNGTVINKWADLEVPSEEDLNAPLSELAIGQEIDLKEKDKQTLIYITALFILPLLLLKFFDFITYGINPLKRRKRKDKAVKDSEQE